MSVYRIAGVIFLILAGLAYSGATLVPGLVTDVAGIGAGIALLAGV